MKKSRFLVATLSVLLIFSFSASNVFCIESKESINDTTITFTDTLDINTVPEVIPYDVARASGHILRDYSQEDLLNSVVFKNADDTNTMYLFDEDVKYIDDDGSIKDKSNTLIRNVDGSYRNVHNDIKISYPAKISEGITLSYNGMTMVMIPEGITTNDTNLSDSIIADSTVSLITDSENSVQYDNVFGDKTMLRYTQTYSGFKEDIIFGKTPQSNILNFIVITKNGELRFENGTLCVFLEDKLMGEFGKIIIYDAHNNYALGDIALDTIKEDCYRITITIPREYLDSNETIYPVVVDPSLTITTSNSNQTIEDATIFTNYKTGFGEWFSLFVGNYNAWYPSSSQQRGTARTLMDFPGLYCNTTFKALYNAGRVTSVKLNFADIDCESGPNTIKAYKMTKPWIEHAVYYDSQSEGYNGEIWDSYTTSNAGGSVTINPVTRVTPYPRYQIDITNIISYYMSITEAAKYGLMLKSTNENLEAVVLGSTESGEEGGRSDSKPYLTINYSSMPTSETEGIFSGAIYQLINLNSGKAIAYNGSGLTQQNSNPSSDTQQFKIKYISNGQYELIPVKDQNYTKRISASNSTLSVATSNNTNQQRWHFVKKGGGFYYIYSKYNSDYLLSAEGSSTSISSCNTTIGSQWTLLLVRYDVPLYEQQEDNTCGPACGTMTVHYYGRTDVTEAQFKAYEGAYFTFAYRVKDALNHYLDIEYEYQYISNIPTEAEYRSIIDANIKNNHLVLVQAKIPVNSPYFEYDSEGHWLVICGYYYDTASQEYYVAINDPHPDYCSYIYAPVSVIYQYNQDHGGCILKVDDAS